MKTYGLLGQHLLHSLSPEIHRELGNYKYDLFQLEPNMLDDFFSQRDFSGLNVIYPYKRDVLKYCDEITDAAKRIGCVDTIIVDENGKLIGDNTEYDGFCYMINKSGINVAGHKVMIFGTGSSSLSVRTVVEDMGASSVVVVSEDGDVNYENFYSHVDVNILINTTAVGRYPNNGEKLVDITRFPDLCGVMELIYNPRRTKLICDAEDAEIPNTDGLSMLVAQAYQTEIKFGRISPDEELIKTTYKTMSDRRKNIMFVGLPGCGKTTIAKVVAAKLGRPCIDVDRIIEMKAGMPISTIFSAYGERYYRELESEALEKITRNGGQIISTDSGAIVSLENQYYIRQNGYVVWLSRAHDKLRTNGAYLIKNRDAIERISKEREPVYKALADITIEVTDNAENTVSEIIRRMGIKENPTTYY